MDIRYIDAAPKAVTFSPDDDDVAAHLDPSDIAQIAEIFRTPLEGTYVWSYQEVDQRIQKLYRLGKERNWNVDADLDWSQTLSHDVSPLCDAFEDPYLGWACYDALSKREKTAFRWHLRAWSLSQFLHGEQGSLLVSSQLVSCAPSYDAKLYAASQTFDEARHVEAFSRYLREKVRIHYPVNIHLKSLLDKILGDERWDLKFIGMQLIIESLALAAFQVEMTISADPLLKEIIALVLRDESRHVAFGVNYMEEFIRQLPEEQVAARAEFAFEACRVMRERIVPLEVFAYHGFDLEEGRRRFLQAGQLVHFRNLLFTRIMPNLKRVGLLPEAIQPRYERLGLMTLANLPSDGDIDWAALAAPLPASASTEHPTSTPGSVGPTAS